MFGLLNIAYKSMRKKQEKRITVVLLGCDGAGKTTLLHTLRTVSNEQAHGRRRNRRGLALATVTASGGEEAGFNPAPTIGFDEQSMLFANYACTIYDVGGSRGGRMLWPSYLDEVHAVVFVVDAADLNRLQEVKEVLHSSLRHEKVVGKPVLILCNKQDLPGTLSAAELSERLELHTLTTSPYQIHPCIARRADDLRIFKGFKWLGASVASDYAKLVARVERDVAEKKRLEQEERAERKRRIEERKRERERAEREAEAEAAAGGAATEGAVAVGQSDVAGPSSGAASSAPAPPAPAQVEMHPVPTAAAPTAAAPTADEAQAQARAPAGAPRGRSASSESLASNGQTGNATVPSTPSAIAVDDSPSREPLEALTLLSPSPISVGPAKRLPSIEHPAAPPIADTPAQMAAT
jgi:ADP-ribosylation factor-like protein 13B